VEATREAPDILSAEFADDPYPSDQIMPPADVVLDLIRDEVHSHFSA
jgi:hypothetical protein